MYLRKITAYGVEIGSGTRVKKKSQLGFCLFFFPIGQVRDDHGLSDHGGNGDGEKVVT